MPGDWVKIKSNLDLDIKVFQIADRLETTSDKVVLSLYRLTCWINSHGKYGNVEARFLSVIDRKFGKGLSLALESVGWLSIDNGWIMFSGFTLAHTERKAISKKLRLKIKSDGCKHCGSFERLEIDHDIPVSRGGTHDEANLICLCFSCNRRKATKTFSEFSEELF